MIVSIDWRSPAIVLVVLQANEVSLFVSNRNKEHQRSKALHNGVLIVEGEVEGNLMIGYHLLNHLFCFGCLTVEVCMD